MQRFELKKKVLNENDKIAGTLRARFREHGIFCLNFIGSPGAGKTALLEETLRRWPEGSPAAVLTGDIETENDARRLEQFGFPTKQICTEGACHLDATMIERSIADWDLAGIDALFIENVGNLVCPSSFDLGETGRVVVLSVTEGDDKPLKYPTTFARSGALVLNKIDLLPHVQFDTEALRRNVLEVHPDLEILATSCTSSEGIDDWMKWLSNALREERTPA